MPNEEAAFNTGGTGQHQSDTNDADAERISEPMHTQYPSMFGRMVELESVIATVRSSLDNHASSYYSVASQIAELNARIGHLGILDKSTDVGLASVRTSDGQGNTHNLDPATEATEDVGERIAELPPVEQSDRESSDVHYTRIQHMIDSLIKDADSALQSNPAASNRFSICSDDSVDIPGKVSAFFSEPPSSMSGEFGETPTLISDAEPGIQDSPPFSFTRPHAPCLLSDLEYHPEVAPRQKQQPHTCSYSPLAKHRAIVVDPTEADGESDSEVSVRSVLGARHRRRNHNMYSKRPYSSRSRRRGGPSYYGERTAMGSRRRSNTVESIFSNSSETCVSPMSRTSKDFHNSPKPYYVDCSRSLVSSPAGQTFQGFERDMLVVPEDHVHSAEQQGVFSAPATANKHTHEFPHLSFDSSGDARLSVRAERRLSSPLIRRVPPLINRFRNTVTRAALRSASFVDDSVHEDIAALGISNSRDKQSLRTRSSTYGGEYLSVMFSQPDTQHPADAVTTMLDVRRHSNSSDNEQEKRQSSGSFIKGKLLLSPTAATKYVASNIQGDGDSSAAGILSIFSLIYWTLLFTLGALMLDSFLCQVAGKRVMGTVDRIAQTQGEDDLLDSSGRRNSSRRGEKSRADDNGGDNVDAGAVGRLVRWYMEDGPDDAPGVRGLRQRKVQAASGLFKHVDKVEEN